MRNVLTAALVAIALAGVPAAIAETRDEATLPPVDETAMDPDFAAFRARLTDIVQRHDWQALEGMLAPDVIASFGGDVGRESFVSYYAIKDPEAPFWQEFADAMALGGTFDDPAHFTAPYTFSRWRDEYDPFSYAVVIKAETPLRADGNDAAPAMRSLGYEILEVIETGESEATFNGYMKVKSLRGETGFVRIADVRSPLDYRAGFEKREDGWTLNYFLAGD